MPHQEIMVELTNGGSLRPPRELGDSGQLLLGPDSRGHCELLTTVHCLERVASN